MTLKTLAKMALVGALLIGGSAANAADNQADWTTTLNVKLLLLNKLGTDSLKIEVDTIGGAVALTGTAAKRETVELAETVAKSIAGVKTVKNDIHLAANVANTSQASVAAGETEAEFQDTLLQTKVKLALVDQMGTDGFRINTDVASSVVSLAFEKDFTAARRQEAAKIAKGVEGVTKVVSVENK